MKTGIQHFVRSKAALRFAALLVWAMTFVAVVGSTAYAGTNYVFDFNSLADGATNSSVQTYMRGVISTAGGPANGVTVTGAGSERDYNGDNHVVGPVSGSSVTSLTLGNSDANVQHGAPYDSFIYNTNSIKIDMLFSQLIYQVSFDYEIFPNGSCPDNPGSCSVYPDFTFKADGTTVLHLTSVDTETSNILGYTHSPISGPSNREKAPQLLGTSATYHFPDGVSHLEFYDWPERIGVDNLTVSTPEPATLVLLGSGLLGLFALRRRQR